MNAIETIYLDTWEEYVRLFEGFSKSDNSLIFRGQSNGRSGDNFVSWNLTSSFNRKYNSLKGYNFQTVLNQQFDEYLFKSKYREYECKGDIASLLKLKNIGKCYYLQHYGIATCFIDFTFNPLIALYFSMTSLMGASGGRYDSLGNYNYYSNSSSEDYVSIYAVNYQILVNWLGVKEITQTGEVHGLDDYKVCYSDFDINGVKIAIDLNPITKVASENIFNLEKQEGCFLLFDNHRMNISFEDFIDRCEEYKEYSFSDPLIRIYNIGYNSFF